jgi:hypothetical protein
MRYAPDALGRRVGEEGPRVTGMLEADRGAGARPGHPARRLRHARGAGSGDRWRHEVERETICLKAAAAQSGFSRETMRRRLFSGKVKGKKSGGRWIIG